MAYTTINKGSSYFNTVLYTGNGSVRSITGVGFQPDWVWLKNRNSTEWHSLFDAVRGSLLNIRTNSTNAEVSATGTLTSFNSDGFSLGTDPDGYGVNTNTSTYASWNWKANGAGVSNTSGSITSTVSANTTAGFSIVSYTGNGTDNATVGHGLGSSIDFVIVKRRNTTSNWLVQGSKVGTGYGQYLELNGTGAISTASDNIKSVNSSTLTLGTNGSCNTLSDTYIAYCFAQIRGYSKFGSYTGNGSADGTFVYTGFKPAWIVTKKTSAADFWCLSDAVRSPFNFVDDFFKVNATDAEGNLNITTGIDYLSNGFKIRSTDGAVNTSGSTYIYMAFAQNPFVTSGGIPVTAR
jgi:hypothetical protein